MRIFFSLFIYLQTFFSFAQAKWTSSPFEQKAFIENKGQFDGQNGRAGSPVVYGASCEGVELFFSAEGLTYLHREYTQLSKEERIRTGKKKEEAVSERPISHFLHIVWEGADPQTKIVAEDAVSWYYTYPDARDPKGASSFKAPAYKKITYKNLYPNIDLEYVFPENKGGVKYSLILHPGADPAQIKMRYEGANNISIDPSGNAVIQSSFGEFVDHAPQTFYADSKKSIPSSFSVKDNVVSFVFSPSSMSHLPSPIVIDPWTTNPAFPGYNAAYDVEYDFAGNTYVYGGGVPYREIKMNSTGAIQWIYTAALFTVANYYGDFVVDAASQSSYLCEAYAAGGIGTRVAKINPSGAQIGMTAPDPRMEEMWRMVFDQCNRRPIIGGSSFINPNNFQLCLLDTNMTGITPSNVFGLTGGAGTPYNQDISMLAIDNSNNCFSSCCGNRMAKCSAPTLAPTAYVVPNNHAFQELSSINYVMNTQPRTCGMNGMAASAKYVYTYDGSLIKRWNKNSGAFINGATLSPTAYVNGGIVVDDCDNIFLGTPAGVKQYDTNFVMVSAIGGTAAVYDVRLGPGNILYACGNGFVSTYQLNLTSCSTGGTLSVTVTSTGSCSGQGSASVSASGGTAPYSYVWSPSGQTTATATGLFAGTYTVTVSDNSACPPLTKTETVTIVSTGSNMSVTSAQNNLLCNAQPTGSATVTPTGGTAPLTYAWSPTGGSGPSATGLAAGTYTALITDSSGCIVQQIITITQPTPVALTINSTSTTCTSSIGTATANASGGVPVYTYSWSNGASTSSATGLSAGNYSITVTDANGCTKTQTVSVSSGGGVVVNVTSTQTGCLASNGTATAITSSGTTPYTYSWSDGQSTQTATGLAAGNYSVTVTDASGCVQTQTVMVTAAAGPTAAATAAATLITLGGNTSLTGTGGGTYQWTPTTGLSCTTCANPIANPTQTTEYCVIVTDASGCSDSACVTIVVDVPCGNIYVPNAFSPNGDFENDLECVIGNCVTDLHFIIYDRWGVVVFETTDQNICWDGSHKKDLWYSDNPFNTAVFSYYLEATIKGTEKIIQKGNISLIR